MDYYDAAFEVSNATPTVVIPTFESVSGVTADIYVIATAPELGEFYSPSGYTEDAAYKASTASGSGIVSGTLTGYDLTIPLYDWCGAPSVYEETSSMGNYISKSFCIVQFVPDEYSGASYDDDDYSAVISGSYFTTAFRNYILRLAKDADSLITAAESVDSNFNAVVVDGTDGTLTAFIQYIQQWIIDNCGSFVIPQRALDSSDLSAYQVENFMTIAQAAVVYGYSSDFEFFCKVVAEGIDSGKLSDGTSYGFRYATAKDTDDTPLVLYPDSSRTIADNDYCIAAHFKDIIAAFRSLYAAIYSFEWTSGAGGNYMDGSVSEDPTLITFDDAKDAAEADAEISTVEGEAPIYFTEGVKNELVIEPTPTPTQTQSPSLTATPSVDPVIIPTPTPTPTVQAPTVQAPTVQAPSII